MEAETVKWQTRWEQTNETLVKVEKSNIALQNELVKANEGLVKMTDLCRALQTERKTLLNGLKGVEGKENEPEPPANEDKQKEKQ